MVVLIIGDCWRGLTYVDLYEQLYKFTISVKKKIPAVSYLYFNVTGHPNLPFSCQSDMQRDERSVKVKVIVFHHPV